MSADIHSEANNVVSHESNEALHVDATSRFSVINLGCKVNRVESDEAIALFQARGAQKSTAADADVIMVNSCTVTGEAEKKTRKAVRRALRENEHARVIVTGCAAALDPDTYTSMDSRVVVQSKEDLAAFVREGLQEVRSIEGIDTTYGDMPSLLRVGEGFNTRVAYKVQDGCNNACTFCIVHVARGKATSKSLEEIVADAQAYEAQGVLELVLTGINLGAWKDEDKRLPDMLRALLDATDSMRFRLSSIEPATIDEDLIQLMATSDGRICKHLHIPVQSGSDAVLKAMHRPYNTASYKRLIHALYEAMPDISISTDIIVGFPGETEKDFEYTLEMCDEARFSKVHIFRYSVRAGTPAATYDNQVPPEIKQQRAQILADKADRLRRAAYDERCGMQEYALVEDGKVATTESYFTIQAPEKSQPGEMISCVLQKELYVS